MTQLSLWNGIDTPAKSSENEPQTDGFPICQCGKGTLDCSIHPSTPTEWIASMQAFHAKICQSLAIKPDWEKELEAVSTGKSCGLLASFDPDTCSWKTCQQSLVTDSEPYSQTWPRWGMTHGGFAYAHPMSERRITGIGGGYWPTPTVADTRGQRHQKSEYYDLRHWWMDNVGGLLDPSLPQWLMGFPTDWASLEVTEMLKYPCKPPLPGNYSEANK